MRDCKIINKVMIYKFISIFIIVFILFVSFSIYYEYNRYTPLIKIIAINEIMEDRFKGIPLTPDETDKIILLLDKYNINYKINNYKKTLEVKTRDLDKSTDIFIYEFNNHNLTYIE